MVPKVSAENAWVPWSTAGGSISERDERAGAGERGRERATPRRTQRWGREELEGRRRRQAEEVGGVGRTPAPAAREAVVCSLPATGRALIRRPEPPGRPLPPGAHVTRGRGPRPLRPGRPAKEDREEWGRPRRLPAPGKGRGLKPRRGLCGPGSTHHPRILSCPRDKRGEAAVRGSCGSRLPGQALS